MKPKKTIGRILFVSIAVAAAVFLLYRFGPPVETLLAWGRAALATGDSGGYARSRHGSDLAANLKAVLDRLEADTAAMHSQLFLEEHTREMVTQIPRGLPLEHIVWLLTDACRRTPYRVVDCLHDSHKGTYHIVYESRRGKDEKIRLIFARAPHYYSKTARIAFLIQDFGFEADKTTIDFLSFPQPLTVSLAATEDKSAWTARIANYYKKEIVVLLPLESKRAVVSERRGELIMVHHAEDQIVSAVVQASRRIPNFSGYCSLWGSRLLEDTRATRILLGEVKRQHGYFIDTKTTPASLVPQLAVALGVPYRQVDARVEAGADQQAVAERLTSLIHRAQKLGAMLVTAPPTAAFIDALTEVEPLLGRSGVQFTYVSDILIHPEG